jgi:hypothetical protein
MPDAEIMLNTSPRPTLERVMASQAQVKLNFKLVLLQDLILSLLF